jgi:hypothetical protein
MFKSLLTGAFLALVMNYAIAQRFEIGLTFGSTAYNGDIDIAITNLPSTLHPAIGLLGKYRIANSLLLRAQVLSGLLSGSEKNHLTDWRRERGLAFETNLLESALMLEYEWWKKDKWTALAMGGAALTMFTPHTDYNTPSRFVSSDNNPDAVSQRSQTTVAIPLSVGMKYALPQNFFVAAEVGYRLTFTDYLDGISKIGNPDRNDAYYFAALTVTKAFGGAKRAANNAYQSGSSSCPKF